tara:strand:+ start:335 stop:616 length:282 start_codon:yes stop_codon:yes gene_type:complete
MNKNKLNIVRMKLDKLDYKILDLIKIRTNLVKEVIKIKKFKKQIVDKKRIKFVLTRIKNKSIKKKIDTILTKKIWQAMIKSYIDFEKRNFGKK